MWGTTSYQLGLFWPMPRDWLRDLLVPKAFEDSKVKGESMAVMGSMVLLLLLALMGLRDHRENEVLWDLEEKEVSHWRLIMPQKPISLSSSMI